MELSRQKAISGLDELRQQWKDADAAFVTEYRGLSVGTLAALRTHLRRAGAEYKVYKNTLARLGARDVGIAGLEDLLVGPTGIAFVKGDVAAAAKLLRDQSRANPLLVLKGGSLGSVLLSADDVLALADLPSREVLLAQFAGALSATLCRFPTLVEQVIDREVDPITNLTAEETLVDSYLPWATTSDRNEACRVLELHTRTITSARPLDFDKLNALAARIRAAVGRPPMSAERIA